MFGLIEHSRKRKRFHRTRGSYFGAMGLPFPGKRNDTYTRINVNPIREPYCATPSYL